MYWYISRATYCMTKQELFFFLFFSRMPRTIRVDVGGWLVFPSPPQRSIPRRENQTPLRQTALAKEELLVYTYIHKFKANLVLFQKPWFRFFFLSKFADKNVQKTENAMVLFYRPRNWRPNDPPSLNPAGSKDKSQRNLLKSTRSTHLPSLCPPRDARVHTPVLGCRLQNQRATVKG